MLRNLVVNLSVLTTLVFIYFNIRRLVREKAPHPLVLFLYDGFSGGIMGYVLMQFSLVVQEGTIIDYRLIPIILIFHFIDEKAAILSTVLVAHARFYFGFVSTGILLYLFVGLILGLYLIKFLMRKSKAVYLKGCLMVIYATAGYTVYLLYQADDPYALGELLSWFWLLSIVGGLFAIFLMDYLKNTEMLLRRYEIESTTDHLTGLHNVRNFDWLFNRYAKESEKEGDMLALAMLDIDFFKSVNDTHGHTAGDKVLMEVAQILKDNTCTEAMIFRKGGEEFAILFPERTLDSVIQNMEACRKAIEMYPFQVSQQEYLRLTISVGICHFPEQTERVKDLMKKADANLYKAKERGRNRVVH